MVAPATKTKLDMPMSPAERYGYGARGPTSRWYPLYKHPAQILYYNSKFRFNIVPAGRRSGKSERAKRRLVRKALGFRKYPDGWFIASAPTHKQAKRIFWKDLKMMVPDGCIVGKSESELTLDLINGATIQVLGMDVPERVEGPPLDHILLDEYGNMKGDAWGEHIRPALSTPGRPGSADFIGVPEGRNHYYETWIDAQTNDRWGAFTWPSADILDPEEIEDAKNDLDPLTFQQEYEASFVTFKGRAYYNFDREVHANTGLRQFYDKKADLYFCFDFNRAPGVAVVCQEFPMGTIPNAHPFTGVIGEVHVPQNSNTPIVCRRLKQDWGKHEGRIFAYGDSTGGAGGSAKVKGSDWDLIRDELGPHYGSRLRFRVPKANPAERSRVNSVNSRVQAASGVVRFRVDPIHARWTAHDFEGVRVRDDGSGDIDKKRDPKISHLSDAVGYYIVKEYPTTKRGVATSQES